MTTLEWKLNAPSKECEEHWKTMNYAAFKAEVCTGVTYHVDNLTSYGAGDINRCWLVVIGPRGRKQKFPLGSYRTMEEAKLACEQRYADHVEARNARRAYAPKPQLKRPRGALLRAIVSGLVSTEQAHKQAYMGKAEVEAIRAAGSL